MEDIKVIILHTSLFSRSAESTCSWTLASLFAANSSRDRVGTGGGGGATGSGGGGGVATTVGVSTGVGTDVFRVSVIGFDGVEAVTAEGAAEGLSSPSSRLASLTPTFDSTGGWVRRGVSCFVVGVCCCVDCGCDFDFTSDVVTVGGALRWDSEEVSFFEGLGISFLFCDGRGVNSLDSGYFIPILRRKFDLRLRQLAPSSFKIFVVTIFAFDGKTSVVDLISYHL